MTETKVAHDCGDVRWLKCKCLIKADCDMCGGITSPHSKRCENCNGTGLRFLRLSEKCPPCCMPHAQKREWKGNTEHCPDCECCQGRRRVPVDAEGTWMDVLDNLGELAGVRHQPDAVWYASVVVQEIGYLGRDAIRLDAIKQAICKAVGAHEEESDATPRI